MRLPRRQPAPSGPEPSPLGGVVYPSNEYTYRARCFGPPPIAAVLARSLDLRYVGQLAGRSRSGSSAPPPNVRGQDQSNAYAGNAYRGDLGPLQAFTGAAWLGAMLGTSSGGIRPGLNTVLPGTNAPPQSPVQRLLATLGQVDQNASAHRA